MSQDPNVQYLFEDEDAPTVKEVTSEINPALYKLDWRTEIYDDLKEMQYYLGSIYDTYPNNDSDAVLNEIANGKYVAVLSNMSETESEKIKSDRTVFERIYERFELNELVSVE